MNVQFTGDAEEVELGGVGVDGAARRASAIELPVVRGKFMAVDLNVAMFWAPWPVRMREASSPKVTSCGLGVGVVCQ